ncbi:MAG: PAS domain S-box protein [Candidatus Thermoplasmatota archaeon]|nr:PAS domain S-box protein [Candidatus Thermoplasmatota archaeon]
MERISKNSLELKQKVYSEKIGNFVNFDFFNLLMETSPDYIFVKDSNLCFIAVNKRAAWALGVSDPIDAIGKSDIDFFPDIADMTRAAEQRIIETGEPQIDEDINVRFADGSDHWVSVTKLPLKDDDGRVMGIIGISRDITERIKIKSALQQKSDELQIIFDNSPNCMYIKDTDGRYLAANKVIADLYQTTPVKMIGKTDSDFSEKVVLKPNEAKFFIDIDQKAIQTKEPQIIPCESFTWKDGTIHYFHTTKIPITYNDDTDCVLGISVDITTIKRSEIELKLSESRFKKSQEIGKMGSWEWDVNNDTLLWSDELYTIFDVNKDKFVLSKENITERIHPDDREKNSKMLSSLLKKENVNPIELRILQNDGYYNWIRQVIEVIKDDSGEIKLCKGIMQDITEQKNAEEKANQYQANINAILENTENMICLRDRNHHVIYFNKPFSEMIKKLHGVNAEIGMNTLDFLSVEKRKYWLEILSQVLEGDKYRGEFEWDFGDKVCYFDISFNPVRANDEIIGYSEFCIDITKKNEIESALRENEQKLMSLIDSSTEWIWQVDMNGIYQFVSGSVQTVIGYHPSEVIGKTPFDFMTPEEAKRVGSIFSDILNKKERISKLEDVLLKKNGEPVYFETDAIPLFDDNGDLLGYFGVCRDITKRKESEEKLKYSIERYKTLFENNVAGVGIAYADGTIITANESMCRLLDYSYDEFLDMNVTDLYVQPDERKKILQLLEKDQVLKDYKVQLYAKNRKPLWADISIKPINIEGKQAFITTAFDITDIYTAREQLKLEQSKLLNIFNGMSEVIYIADTDTYELLYMNESGKKYWGDRIGEKCYTVLQHRDTPCPFCSTPQLIEQPDKTHIWEFQNEVNNEWYRCIDRLIPWTNGKMVRFELAINITDIKEIQKEISEKNNELHQQNLELNQMRNELMQLNANLESIVQERTGELEKLIKMKDDFIEQLGHDLKNPLGPLINLLPLLEKHSSRKEDKEIFTVLKRNVDYMKNLVKKTLYFSQLGSPNCSFNPKDVDLRQEVEDIIDLQKDFCTHQNIMISNNIQKNINLPVDIQHFKELISNLLNNAVKYSPDGGQIHIDATQKEDDILTISIKDTGIGLSDKEISHLFEEFYKVDGSRHDFTSTGLGLPICKRIVEKHGGSIWVESPGHGKGSTFYVSFPLMQPINVTKEQ